MLLCRNLTTFLQFILVFSLVDFSRSSYGGYQYPLYADVIGATITLIEVLCIPGVALYKIWTVKDSSLNFIQVFQLLHSNPTDQYISIFGRGKTLLYSYINFKQIMNSELEDNHEIITANSVLYPQRIKFLMQPAHDWSAKSMHVGSKDPELSIPLQIDASSKKTETY